MHVTNTRHGQPHRNADIAHQVLVVGRAPVRVAEDNEMSLPRLNQIVTQYGMQVLGVPPGFQRPIAVLKSFVEKHCIENNKLIPCKR